jgi:hypothetical protein
VLGELAAAGREDLLGELGADARPGTGCSGHADIIAYFESNDKNQEHCS